MNGLGRKKEKQNNKNQSVFTKETLGVVLVLFATLCLVCLITRESVFSLPGKFVNAFLFGCFGFFAYAVVLFTIILGVNFIVGRKSSLSLKNKILLTVSFCALALIVHVITLHGQKLTFWDYLIKSYLMADNGFASASGGGFITALLAYPITLLLTEVGTYVVFGLIFAVSTYFLVKDLVENKGRVRENNSSKFNSSFVSDEEETGVQIQGEMDYPITSAVQNVAPVQPKTIKQKLFVSNENDFALKNKREMLKPAVNGDIKMGVAGNGLNVAIVPEEKPTIKASDNFKTKIDYIKTPPEIDLNAMRTNIRPSVTPKEQDYFVPKQTSQTVVSNYVNNSVNNEEEKTSDTIPFIEHVEDEIKEDSISSRARAFDKYAEVEDVKTDDYKVVEDNVIFRAIEDGRIEEIVDDNSKTTQINDIPFIEETYETSEVENVENKTEIPDLPTTNVRGDRARSILFGDDAIENDIVKEEPKKEIEPKLDGESLGFTSRVNADGNSLSRRERAFNFDKKEETVTEEPPKKEAPPINREYFRPPLDLLENYAPPIDAPKENHEERQQIIQSTLEQFRINAIPRSFVQGPSITRYEIEMPAGISVKKVLGYDDDLKMRLKSKEGVRIEAPIPGKDLVGIEVANNVKTTVGLREILEGFAEQNSKEGALMFALGKDLVGKCIVDDLSKGPHYLVAGATGSGKSVCLNLMIVSLIMRYSPEDLRLILVDPKGVEFVNYEHIPHLMIDEIITEPKKALAVLSWAYAEMERRFSVFRENGGGLVVDIDSYNKVVASDTVAKMPRIVIIIDELADLMETCKKDLESRIRAIAQKARAAGIHLVLATQRPSVDIITGTIKANLPSRIAFKVTNFNDSQTILNEAGAEKLLGNGDMLYRTARMSSTERYQGGYISSREVNSVVTYIKEKNVAYFDDELTQYLERETKPKQEEVSATEDGGDEANEVNEFFLKALWLAVNTETVSISQLQRRFQIGYSRAGGLVDKMERMGFVSPNEGSKARRVLLTREEFEERFGQMPD